MSTPSKFVRDTWLVFQRSLLLTTRNPTWIVIGLLQPLYYLLLFGPLLKNVRAPGVGAGNAAYAWFIPGLLTQLAPSKWYCTAHGQAQQPRHPGPAPNWP